ncbi:MAG: hypothetical protein QG625_4039 [Cyanobacteriota bacterium erpe_2018_sw_39hr_WHONDRS-SW48-000098_B_bin.30]|jgi:tetratricopeptide (TPR) repeat protein|nr:hypothetical protein [Cyanobacteriota bacterium erpe_2018_sw_39hr_WHONDRS-SW48-000098_B_bin.30]
MSICPSGDLNLTIGKVNYDLEQLESNCVSARENIMKNNESKPKKARYSWIKLLLFGVFSFVIVTFAVIWNKYGAVIAQVMFVPQWRQEFDSAKEHWQEDRPRAQQMIDKAIKDAHQSNATPFQLMAVHRDYACLLYDNGEFQKGHDEITKAIAAAPATLNPVEADLLSHVYQERGWERHREHFADESEPDGIEDQTKSVEVSEKAFGANAHQTIDKLSSLAVMYSEDNQKEKAKDAFAKVINASDNIKGCEGCGWYAYAMKARSEAGERDYKNAMKDYLHACTLAQSDEQKERIYQEFYTGVSYHKPPRSTGAERARGLFNKGQYKELDAMAQDLRKSGKACADGFWDLDLMYWIVEGAANNHGQSQSDYEQSIFDLNKWLKAEPKSAMARIALADCYVDYAWLDRGGGWANEVTDKGWRLYKDRIAKAKQVLDASPQLCKQDPRASYVYDRIALAGEIDREQYFKMVDACHKDWPDYTPIDLAVGWYLLPRWHGEEYDTEKYIEKRATEIGGVKGDLARARMAWKNSKHLNNAWTAESPMKWVDVKRGFNEMFKQYPNDIDARLAFMNISRRAHDQKGFEQVFEMGK